MKGKEELTTERDVKIFKKYFGFDSSWLVWQLTLFMALVFFLLSPDKKCHEAGKADKKQSKNQKSECIAHFCASLSSFVFEDI